MESITFQAFIVCIEYFNHVLFLIIRKIQIYEDETNCKMSFVTNKFILNCNFNTICIYAYMCMYIMQMEICTLIALQQCNSISLFQLKPVVILLPPLAILSSASWKFLIQRLLFNCTHIQGKRRQIIPSVKQGKQSASTIF